MHLFSRNELHHSFNQPQRGKKYCYNKPKIRHFEPTKVFFKLLDFSIVNQIRLVTAIFKCKSCSTAKGTCLGFEINDCFYTQSCILLRKEKGGFCNVLQNSLIHFFIEMLFQWCIFFFNKVLIQNKNLPSLVASFIKNQKILGEYYTLFILFFEINKK